MADWSNDIEKYRKGELSSSEMHALEKRALNDPFLADALEGAEHISEDQFSFDVNELNEKIKPSKKNPIWTPLRIAAGILLVLGVSFTMYFLSDDKPGEQLAEQSQPQSTAPSPEAAGKLEDTITNKPAEDLLALNKVKEEQKPDGTAIKKEPVKSSGLAGKVEGIKASEVAPVEEKRDVAVVASEAEQLQSLDTKEENLAAQPQRIESIDSVFGKDKSVARDRNLSRAKKLSAPSVSEADEYKVNRQVTGQVISAEDGQPLPGVNVMIKGTSTGTITDGEGHYSIDVADQRNAQLIFSFIGVQTTEEPVKNQTNIDVELKNDVSQLSEVVVVGYGASEDSSEPNFPTVTLPEPAGGRRAFNKYLEANLQYPQQALDKKIEGRVTVQFIVKTDGRLDEFKVVKGIGAGCDEEVIRLIKVGPKWSPSFSSEKPVDSRMRVRMRFKLPR